MGATEEEASLLATVIDGVDKMKVGLDELVGCVMDDKLEEGIAGATLLIKVMAMTAASLQLIVSLREVRAQLEDGKEEQTGS